MVTRTHSTTSGAQMNANYFFCLRLLDGGNRDIMHNHNVHGITVLKLVQWAIVGCEDNTM